MPEQEGNEQEKLLHVALFREASDLRALHKLMGTQIEGEPWEYWDAEGVPLTSAVGNLLSVCGFGGVAPPKPDVRKLDEDDVNVVPLMGFTVPASQSGAVQAAILSIARGQIGGFSPIVVAQSGFHDAAIDVFAYVWSQLERPPIWIHRPALGSRGATQGVPAALLPLANADSSFALSLFIRSLSADDET